MSGKNRFRATNLICPHCNEPNEMLLSLPLHGRKEYLKECYHGGRGCQKKFQVITIIQIGTDFTQADKREREKAMNQGLKL